MELGVGEGAEQGAGEEGVLPGEAKFEWHHVVIKPLCSGVSDLGLNPSNIIVDYIYLSLSAKPSECFMSI